MLRVEVASDYSVRLFNESNEEIIWRRAALTFHDIMEVLCSREASECCLPDIDKIYALAKLLGQRCKQLDELRDPVPWKNGDRGNETT